MTSGVKRNLDREELLSLYNKGYSLNKIANLYKADASTIKDYLKLPFYEKRYAHNSKTDRNKEIVNLYLSGKSSAEIGKIFGITGDSVLDILQRNNIKRRKIKGQKRSQETRKKMSFKKKELVENNQFGCLKNETLRKELESLIKNPFFSKDIKNISQKFKIEEETLRRVIKNKYGEEIKRDIEEEYDKLKDIIQNNFYSYAELETLTGLNKEILAGRCRKLGIVGKINHFKSSKEEEIALFLKENNINFLQGERKLIYPYELDFYIPDFKLAIEFNGVFWHNFNFVPINYHYKKFKLCEEKGIHLIQIWEDQWLNKKEIILNILKTFLKIKIIKIGANKCKIRELTPSEYREFCNKEHLQGYRAAKIKLGLFYKNKLIQLVSFTPHKKYEWEWVRGCFSSTYEVIGGTKKLLAFFIKKYNPNSILCFSDNNYFTGDGYLRAGFTLEGEIDNNKFYVEQNSLKRIMRDPGRYKELMQKVKEGDLFLCYGAGSKKFIWKK